MFNMLNYLNRVQLLGVSKFLLKKKTVSCNTLLHESSVLLYRLRLIRKVDKMHSLQSKCDLLR